MKNVTARLIVVVMATLMLSTHSAAAPAPQLGKDNVSMESMSVADLEKAGDLARAQKDYTLAIRYFQTALRKDRKNAVLYNKLGLAELRINDLDRKSVV